MIGDKYIVKEDFFDEGRYFKKGDILTEREAFNFKTECREDGGDYNELIHNEYGFVCDVGSDFAKNYLEKCI